MIYRLPPGGQRLPIGDKFGDLGDEQPGRICSVFASLGKFLPPQEGFFSLVVDSHLLAGAKTYLLGSRDENEPEDDPLSYISRCIGKDRILFKKNHHFQRSGENFLEL